MPSERVRRQIDRLLDEAEQAAAEENWSIARARSLHVLRLDPDNEDARAFLAAAEREPLASVGSGPSSSGAAEHGPTFPDQLPASQLSRPYTAFSDGRYIVKKLLGEGGKKRVYLAHDNLLDRDVAFALIRTEGLDGTGRDRILREAQSMGRLGAHPHIVSVFDLGDEAGQPYIVTELMVGGDVEGLIEKATEHRPALERSLEIGIQVCRGLEFAHSHGIVHRDLKPGNVWLAADGTAKLGDFGLAVALDRTRLTQAGMMVGTVSYMPPEQAMGGEVISQSDLYSLGAMLYELVTGRPPFVGDESVAIITQHLNVTPVSPSWHNASVPPALEALIVRLLEKDPAKRPQSAAEVREALESIAEAARHPSPSIPLPQGEREAQPSPLMVSPSNQGDGLGMRGENPMYRRTFVGREPELKQLHGAYDAATSGQGSLVMVVGEPGIGKTSVCEQLATYATVRGGRTLVGHCYEEGSLSLPYLPFVEAMRSYVLAREPDALRRDLGSGAGDIARIVSEIRDRLPDSVGAPSAPLRVSVSKPPAATADPEEERYRLFQAVSSFLRNAATVQPLVIVLEDLHDADRGTLELLLHVSRNLNGSRMLIVGTYRDIEVDRAHPLSSTLAELRRSSGFSRVLLRGLTTDEVQRMLSSISGQEVRWELAEAVHRQTEGNPLFVQEVLRYLVEEGLIKREDGRWRQVGDTPLVAIIPEGLRDVIGKRLSRLSPECNRLLSVASVIGRDFSLATLQAVAVVEQDALVEVMEEARRVAVLTEQARVGVVQYRFAHAFFRQTLYEELGAARRLRMHQDVARVLEGQYAGRLEEHAAELAEHFTQSTDPADLAKAVRYAELAAQRALAVYAYGEAARHLEQALDVQEVLDPNDKTKRCDLLLGLGETLIPAGDPVRAAEDVATEALALAESTSDQRRAARACRVALLGLRIYGATMASTPAYRLWAERADRCAAPETSDRVIADIYLAEAALASERWAQAWELRGRALILARQLNDSEHLFHAALGILSMPWAPRHMPERYRLAQEFSRKDRAGTSAWTLGATLNSCAEAYLEHGERERWEELTGELRELAGRTQEPLLLLLDLRNAITTATLDGELDTAVATADRLIARSDELGSPFRGRQFFAVTAVRAFEHLGRFGEWNDHLSRGGQTIGGERSSGIMDSRPPSTPVRGSRPGGIQVGLGDFLRPPDSDAASELPSVRLVNFLETAVLMHDRVTAAKLCLELASLPDLVIQLTSVARDLGAASALFGEHEQAASYYKQALEVCARLRFRPETALTRLQMAELLLSQAESHRPPATSAYGSRSEALAHLDFAIAEFREMKMQPSLERALRHKEVLKA